MNTEQQHFPAGRLRLLNILLILGLSILLCGEAYFGYQLHSLSGKQEQIKEDYSTINNITFGLFSVDQWREKISAVVNGQVHNFNLTRAQKKALQAEVEQQLHGLINKTIATINKPQTTFSGKVKRFAFDKFVNTAQIQAQVPGFAKTIINRVNSPASKKRLKDIAQGKIHALEKATYDSTQTAITKLTNDMYHKYQAADADTFNREISSRLTSIRTVTYHYAYAMLGCVLAALMLWWFLRNQVHLHAALFIMLLMFALILLIVGITASIIEVDARISTLNFMLLNQKIAFENQVLFFQSKSIFGIIEVLLKQPKPDAIVVGTLILIFVIILPVVRMIARGVRVLSSKASGSSKVVNYLAYQSAKWDMADVMVVGVIMTYIGLNGILKSQLANLNIHNSFLTAVTVNNSSLQPGYFIFVGYVVFALVISTILKRITPEDAI